MDAMPVYVINSNPFERKFIEFILSGFYLTKSFSTFDLAFSTLGEARPQAIIIDELVLPAGAYELIEQIRADASLDDVPLFIYSSLPVHDVHEALRHFNRCSYILKTWPGEKIISTISEGINHAVEAQWEALPAPQSIALKESFGALRSINETFISGGALPYPAVKQACLPMVKLIYENQAKDVMDAVKRHDNYTYAHSFRVAMLLAIFGHTLGLDREEQVQLAGGGLLHDVGKMDIPLAILAKPGRLTDDEWKIMKTHVTTTIDFLKGCHDLPKGTLIIASQHHEKLDGTGYPNGLKGSEINDVARMAGIVDIYGALTDRRSYKPAMPAEKAFAIMSDQMSAHVDTGLLKAFRQVIIDSKIDL